MLGKVRIESVTAVDSRAVVGHDPFQRGEATIMHAWRGAGEIAQAGRGEFVGVGFQPGDTMASGVGLVGFQAVVVELIVAE